MSPRKTAYIRYRRKPKTGGLKGDVVKRSLVAPLRWLGDALGRMSNTMLLADFMPALKNAPRKNKRDNSKNKTEY
jgi:hypothetical protein